MQSVQTKYVEGNKTEDSYYIMCSNLIKQGQHDILIWTNIRNENNLPQSPKTCPAPAAWASFPSSMNLPGINMQPWGFPIVPHH